MDEEQLTGIQQEGELIAPEVDESERETTEESSTEANQTEEAASPLAANTEDDSNVPFHKHPRWKEMQEQNRKLTETLEAIKEGQGKMVEAFTTPTEEEVKIPQWFSNLYATGVPEADKRNWMEYNSARKAEQAEMRESIRQDIVRESQMEHQKLTEAEQTLNSQIQEMKEEGMKFDEKALQKFLVEYHDAYGALPVKDGVIDMRKGLELMNRFLTQNQSGAGIKKQVASRSASERGAVDPNGPVKPPIGKRSWFSHTE